MDLQYSPGCMCKFLYDFLLGNLQIEHIGMDPHTFLSDILGPEGSLYLVDIHRDHTWYMGCLYDF